MMQRLRRWAVRLLAGFGALVLGIIILALIISAIAGGKDHNGDTSSANAKASPTLTDAERGNAEAAATAARAATQDGNVLHLEGYDVSPDDYLVSFRELLRLLPKLCQSYQGFSVDEITSSAYLSAPVERMFGWGDANAPAVSYRKKPGQIAAHDDIRKATQIFMDECARKP